MANGQLPFDFSSGAAATSAVDPQDAVRSQWASFLDQPGARAALLNAGIALMQPPSFGDNLASQVGRAIGAGGEAVTRAELLNAKVGDIETRQELARARISQATDRLGLEHFRRKSIESVADANRQAGVFRTYIKDQNDVNKAYQRQLKDWNDLKLTTPASQMPPQPTPPPAMDFSTWMRVRGAGLIGAQGLTAPQASSTKTEDDTPEGD
jgi:hypothetical protein